MNSRQVELVLRTVAISIVVAAIIDPMITSNRTSKPELSFVVVDSARNAALATDVRRNLANEFTVIDAPLSNASASVIVGSSLPVTISELAAPLFVIPPDPSGARASIEGITSAPSAPLATRVPVIADVRVTGAQKKTLTVSLTLDGLVVGQIAQTVNSNDERVRVPVSFIPASTGAATLRVSAAVDGGAKPTVADVVVDVRDQRWPILFFDPRPSWMSTFVRRVVERDARFVVSSRVTSSKGVSRDAGTPPSALDDPAIRSLYDVIVVGAPEALSDRDVSGLETFLRRRGGAVVLLFDQRSGGKYERLIAAGAWDGVSRSAAANIGAIDGDTVALRASEWMWPTRQDVADDVLAWSGNDTRDSSRTNNARHPVVWRASVGAGRVIVSGALDSWKYRDPTQSHFESFWRTTLADAASGSPRAIVASIVPVTAAASTELKIEVQLRDAMLADLSTGQTARSTIGASIVSLTGPQSDSVGSTVSQSVRLWPSTQPGIFNASVRAPAQAGSYRLHVSADGASEDIPFRVSVSAAQATPPDSDVLAAWATSSGGAMLQASERRGLARRIQQSLSTVPRRVSWYPMRSIWWLPAVCAALCIEWWLRRRRGMA